MQFNYQNHRSVGWARGMKGMGKSFKQEIKKNYPAYITFTGYQELVPNKESYIDLDSKRTRPVWSADGAPSLEVGRLGLEALERYA